MAVDSRDKRFSMINFTSDVPWALPNPDGTVDTADRAMLLNLYFGIALGAVVTPTAAICLTLLSRSLATTLQSRSLALTLPDRDAC